MCSERDAAIEQTRNIESTIFKLNVADGVVGIGHADLKAGNVYVIAVRDGKTGGIISGPVKS